MTGGASRLLFGQYVDPYFGKVTATPFTQPTLEGSLTVPEEAVYDSIIVSIGYDKYYYGDTTKIMNLGIHAIQSDIMARSSYFNTSTMPYDPKPLGKLRFYPRPKRDSVITVRLSDEFGNKIFDMAKGNLLTAATDWTNVLLGIAIVPGASDNGAVIGIKWPDNATAIQLHYHTVGTEGVVEGYAGIKVNAAYNQILTDRTGTQLVKLPKTKRLSIPSDETGNMSFIQAGAGLVTRIDIPTVRELKYVKYSVANKAFLKLYPVDQSVTDFLTPPAYLYIYRVNKNNEYYSSASTGGPLALTDLTGSTAIRGVYDRDSLNNEPFYRFDISSYVANILLSDYQIDEGLVLINSQLGGALYPETNTDFVKSVNRLVIAGPNSGRKSPKLELYYTTVKVKE